MIRQGAGEPLVLLHGVTMTERVWREVVPPLARGYDVVAPTALGHRGGPVSARPPVSIGEVIDDAERLLDELGFERAHLVGNSMGGWSALELARRGRALSVCALSPAGMWEPRSDDFRETLTILSTAIRESRRTRPLLPLLARSRRVRRHATRYLSADGARVSAAELIAQADDALACQADIDPSHTDDYLPALDPAPCPVTIAWGNVDRLFPIERYESRARALVPAARFLVLDGVGHVPMLDDPGLVVRTIEAATQAG
jgi:pimeloyl-ACP methyl ester carboxylesterase